jgi:small GTP-binding protein
MENNNLKRIHKIVLLGDQKSGKTQLRENYFGSGFNRDYKLSIGADFSIHNFEHGGYSYILQIWDINAEEGFQRVREVYYRGCSAAIISYDISDRSTFDGIPKWITELVENNYYSTVPMLLIGTQFNENPRKVSKEEGEELANRLAEWSSFEIPFLEISQNEDSNQIINEVLIKLVNNLDISAERILNSMTEMIISMLDENEEEIIEYVNSQKNDFSFYRLGIINYEVDLPQHTTSKLQDLAQRLNISKSELLRRLIIKVVP